MDKRRAIHVLQDCGDAAKGTEFEQVYRMGAAALQEQAEREKGCEYCQPCGWCTNFDRPCDVICGKRLK